MNTPKKMHLDEMTAGKRCLVVYSNKPEDREEAEIMHVAVLENYKGQRTDTPYLVFVRFDDGEEIDCHPANIREVK
jgi:hypothetical protein